MVKLLEGYDSSYVSGIETILKRLEKALSDTQRRMESIQLFIDESTQQISGCGFCVRSWTNSL